MISRSDVPGLALLGLFASGLYIEVVRTARSSPSLIHVCSNLPTTITTLGWIAGICCSVVFPALCWWGPVRVDTATFRWRMSGPQPWSSSISTALRRVVLATGTCAICLSLVLAIFTANPNAFACLVVVTASAVPLALTKQLWRARQWNLTRLPRHELAPNDGLVAMAMFAVTTVDSGWFDIARTVRWCQRRSSAASHTWSPTSFIALLSADAVTLIRRRSPCLRWLSITTGAVVAGYTLEFTEIDFPSAAAHFTVAPAIWTFLAYRCGVAASGGLRHLSVNPALRQALGGDRQLIAAHCVLPVTSVALFSAAAGIWSPIGIATWSIILIGSSVSALRRATRPELPYDAAMYITGQGGVVQPQLLFVLARGHIAVLITAMVACCG